MTDTATMTATRPADQTPARKRLIFFVSADTRTNPRPAWSAYHFARTAASGGLEAEVRLAGNAVVLAQPGGIEDSPSGHDLQDQVVTGIDAGFDISMCPGCVSKHHVSEAEIEAIGAFTRPLLQVLTEVADGRSELIHLGC